MSHDAAIPLSVKYRALPRGPPSRAKAKCTSPGALWSLVEQYNYYRCNSMLGRAKPAPPPQMKCAAPLAVTPCTARAQLRSRHAAAGRLASLRMRSWRSAPWWPACSRCTRSPSFLCLLYTPNLPRNRISRRTLWPPWWGLPLLQPSAPRYGCLEWRPATRTASPTTLAATAREAHGSLMA